MIIPENNDLNNDPARDLNEQDEHKKTVYKETEEPINDEKPDDGDSSSIADIGHTDLIEKPTRTNKPLGSAHEPGTMPGSNTL